MITSRVRPFAFNLLLVLLLNTGFIVSAGDSKDSVSYALTHYTNENGLPQNSVKSIAIDDVGFIWLATESGVVRFDGNEFKLFNKRNTGIKTSRIVSIERNYVDGRVYALSDSWEMLLLSGGRAVLDKSSVADRFKMVIPQMSNQSVVSTTWRSGTFVDIYGRDSLQQNINKQESVLLIDKGLIIWYRSNREIARQELGEPLNVFSTFTKDGSVFLFPTKPYATIKRASVLGLTTVQLRGDILKQAPIKKWVLCGNTVTGSIFIYADQHFYEVRVTPSGDWDTKLLLTGIDFDKEQIISGYYDHKAEKLYLGSAYNGLYIFKRQRFKVRTVNNVEGVNNVFYEIIPFGPNSLLSGRGVQLFSDNTPPRIFTDLKNTRNGFGNAITRSRDGTFWTASSDWLYQRSSDLETMLRRWHVPNIYSLTEGPDGTIWIGTHKKGLYRMEPEKSNATPELFLAIDEHILSVSIEGKDALWAGTDGHLYRIDIASAKAVTIPELDNKIVRSIYIPKRGEVWICTYEDGLFLSLNNKVTHFRLDNNANMNSVHRVLEDRKGFFWLSTNNGLFKILKGDLLRYAAGTSTDIFFQQFNKTSGFHTNEFNGGSNQVGTILNNGILAFSSMNGVVTFNPDAVKDELPDKAIVVDELMIDQKGVAFEDTLVLQFKPKRISAKIVSPYFGNQNNIRYEYKVSNGNDNKEWLKLENPYLVFTALPAGQNVISIRKMAGYHANNYTEKTFVIIIPVAWWETAAAKMGGIVLVAILFWLLVHFRLRYLRHKTIVLQNMVSLRTSDLSNIVGRLEKSESILEQELNYQKRLNESIAHDIHTPLRYLTIATKYLVRKSKNKEYIDDDEIERVHEGSKRIYDYADMLIKYMKSRIHADAVSVQEVALHSLVRNLKGIFRNAMAEKKNEFVNSIDPSIIVRVHVHLLEILLHNLIDNAIKNTSEGKIHFQASVDGRTTQITIADTGRGMEQEMLSHLQTFLLLQDGVTHEKMGLGMKMVRDILLLLKASLHVESELKNGTTFVLLLPNNDGR